MNEEYRDILERAASTAVQAGVGDDSASLVTLRRDPKTGRFMKKEKK